nr:hypothetical protein [Tanacetum cinerariifolium]
MLPVLLSRAGKLAAASSAVGSVLVGYWACKMPASLVRATSWPGA